MHLILRLSVPQSHFKSIFQRYGDRLYRCMRVGLPAGAAAWGTTTGTCFTPACANYLLLKSKQTRFTQNNYTSGGTSKQSLCRRDPGVSYFSTHLSALAVKDSKTKNTVGALMQKLYCDSTRVIYQPMTQSFQLKLKSAKLSSLCPDSRYFMFTEVFG